MKRTRRVGRRVWPAVMFIWAVAGCRPAAPTAPIAGDGRGTAADLAARPLYTFSENDLDRYLGLLHDSEPDLRRRVIHLGRKAIGQPYEIYLLGEFPYEFMDPDPIYCLSKSDCLTFCEHMYSMALNDNWWSFLRTLQRLRYRDGVIGMATRNHYTVADWNRNNAFLFDDLTTKLGGGQAWVPLKQVCKRARFFARYGIGQDIPDEPISDSYVPKEVLPDVLDELLDGDFVNIIRGDAESQGAGHTGMIAIGEDGTVNLLHSASPAVREESLIDYVNRNRRCLGIKILRLRPGAERIMESVLASSPGATEVTRASLTAALARSPLMSTGAPRSYSKDWASAMRLQSYRLTYDTPTDPALQAALGEIDERIGGELGIPQADRAFGVLGLTEQRLAMVEPDTMFYGASVPKICIVMAYFATHPEAAVKLDPQVERELQLVIKRSSNELAAKYSQLIGLEAIQELLQSKRYGFYDEEHGGLWCGKHYGIATPRMGDPVHDHSHGVTVRQCLRFYLMLEQGRLVSAEACAKLKEIFAAPRLEFDNDRFVRGLNGRDVTMIRKSGLWEDWHLDTARVQHGDQVYVLAGMVHHPRGEEYLARVAAAVDEALCGPQSVEKPYAHWLIMHEQPDDFRGGAGQQGDVSFAPGGVLLPVGAGGEGAVYESPVIETDSKFNEVLLSWNVDSPPGVGFSMEVRVGRRFYDTWSPWLYVAEWGDAVPTGEKLTKCDAGWIDVDYFRSKERYDRVQYRVRAVGGESSAGGPEPEPARIERVAVCLSDTTGIPTALRAPTPEPDPVEPGQWRRRLPVSFRSQKTSRPEMVGEICSPTSVAMVMAYRGVDRTSEEVADRVFDARHKIYGNWPLAIQAAYSFGVPGYLARFSDWADVERAIAAGQPLVISIVARPGELTGAPYPDTPGHLLVIAGFDEDGNVAVNDPAVSSAEEGQLSYKRDELETVWMRAKGGTAYVLLPRRQG